MANRDGVLFLENEDGTYDLLVQRRVKEFDINREDFAGALHRARVSPGASVLVEALSGGKEPWQWRG